MKIKLSQDQYNQITQNLQGQTQPQVQQQQQVATPAPKKDYGFFGNLAMDITSPLRMLGEGIKSWGMLAQQQPTDEDFRQYAKMLTTMPESERASFDINDYMERVGKAGRAITPETAAPTFLTGEEMQNVVERPVQTGIGETLKAGSFLVPGGGAATSTLGKIGKAAGTAAISGGMFSGGQAIEEGGDIQDIIGRTAQGAGMGALTGGVFQGALTGLGKGMEKLGGKAELGGLGLKAPKTVTGVLDKEAIETALPTILAEAKQPMTAKGIGATYNSLKSGLTEMLKGVRSPMNKNAVLEDFSNRVLDSGIPTNEGVGKQLSDRILSKLETIGDDALSLQRLKGEAQQLAGDYYDKLRRKNLQPITPKEEIWAKLAESIDNELSTIPGYKENFMDKMTILHSAAPDAVTAFNQGQMVSSPLIAGGVKIPTGGIQNRIIPTMGKLVKGAGKGVKFVGNKMPKNIVGALAAKGTVSKPENASLELPEETKGLTYDESQFKSPEWLTAPTQLGFMQPSQQMTTQPEQFDEVGFLQMARAFGLTPTQAFTQMLNERQRWETAQAKKVPAMTATQKTNQAKLDSSLAGIDMAINLINENQDVMGAIAGSDFMGTLQNLGLTGEWGDRRAYVQTTLSALGQQIAKGLEGGRMTDSDRKFYQAEVVAALKQPPSIALQKLQAIKDRIQEERNVTERQLLGTPQMGDYTDIISGQNLQQ